MFEDRSTQCTVCASEADYVCSGCNIAVYCGLQCQTEDRLQHAELCASRIDSTTAIWNSLQREEGGSSTKFSYFFTNLVIDVCKLLYDEYSKKRPIQRIMQNAEAFAQSITSAADQFEQARSKELNRNSSFDRTKYLLQTRVYISRFEESLVQLAKQDRIDDFRKLLDSVLVNVAKIIGRETVYMQTIGTPWTIFKSRLQSFTNTLKVTKNFRKSLERDTVLLKLATAVVDAADKLGLYIDWLVFSYLTKIT
jgi:hypothetical protein